MLELRHDVGTVAVSTLLSLSNQLYRKSDPLKLARQCEHGKAQSYLTPNLYEKTIRNIDLNQDSSKTAFLRLDKNVNMTTDQRTRKIVRICLFMNKTITS